MRAGRYREGVTVVVGPSGSGKSTLLRCCNRLEVPTWGRVLLRWRRRGRAGPVAAAPPGRAWSSNGPRRSPARSARTCGSRSRRCTDAAAASVLERVGLDAGFLDRAATELSGGEAQRVCLARTLVTRPEVVLMDEVTSSVDPVQRSGSSSSPARWHRGGVAVLWVTHDLAQMRRIADHVLVVIGGRIAHACLAARGRRTHPPRCAPSSPGRRT